MKTLHDWRKEPIDVSTEFKILYTDEDVFKIIQEVKRMENTDFDELKEDLDMLVALESASK